MREPRLIIPGAPHHLIHRGNNRRSIFSYDPERQFFLLLVAEAREKFEIPIHAIALLSNHVHMMIVPPSQEAASGFVHSFAQRYAQWRNKRRGGSGKLWEHQFDAHPMWTPDLFAEKLAYVDFNAVHHDLCQRPEEHKWSTYGMHIGRPELSKIPSGLWTPCEWWRDYGPERYAQWVERCIENDHALKRERDFRLRRPNGTRAR